jgi:hypothetical protein
MPPASSAVATSTTVSGDIPSCVKLINQCTLDDKNAPNGSYSNVFNKESCVFTMTCYAAYRIRIDDIIGGLGPQSPRQYSATEPRLSTNVGLGSCSTS